MSHLEIFPFSNHADHDIGGTAVARLLAWQTLNSFDLLCTKVPNSYCVKSVTCCASGGSGPMLLRCLLEGLWICGKL